nr:uncharacterized protein LOC127321417 [Lolium perenne]XP_051206416.1 uncharacterized protein LOC127321417 [Lolium perenne]
MHGVQAKATRRLPSFRSCKRYAACRALSAGPRTSQAGRANHGSCCWGGGRQPTKGYCKSSATCACRTPHLAVRREPRSRRPLVATRKSHRVQNGKHAVTGGGNTTMRLARKLVVSKRGLAIAEKGEESRSSASTPPPSTAPLSPEQIGALSNLAKSARKKGASLQPSRPPLPRWLPQSSKPLFFCQFASGRNCIPNESQPCYRECLRPQGLCL